MQEEGKTSKMEVDDTVQPAKGMERQAMVSLNDDLDAELLDEEKAFLLEIKKTEVSQHYPDRALIIFGFSRKLDVKRTEELLKRNWAWRVANGYEVLPKFEDVDPGMVKDGTCFGIPGVRALNGSFVTFISMKHFSPGTYDRKKLVDFFVWNYTYFIQSESIAAHRKGIYVIEDLGGMKFRLDMKLQNKLGEMFKDNFPQQIKKILILNPPGFFKFLIKVAKLFMKSKVVARVQVVKNQEELLQYVDASNLPTLFGGSLDYNHVNFMEDMASWAKKNNC